MLWEKAVSPRQEATVEGNGREQTRKEEMWWKRKTEQEGNWLQSASPQGQEQHQKQVGGGWELAVVKALATQHEDQCSDSQNPFRCWVGVEVCSLGRRIQGEPRTVSWQVRLVGALSVCSVFERETWLCG